MTENYNAPGTSMDFPQPLRRSHRPSTMEDHGDSTQEDDTTWSTRSKKKKKKMMYTDRSSVPQIFTQNPFAPLPIDVPPELPTMKRTTTIPPPPPIFVKTISNYQLLRTELNNLIGENNYSTKCTSNGLTIRATTPETYKAVNGYLKQHNADFHTYQNPLDKAHRIVIRHIHPTMPPNEISSALQEKGFTVRSVHNALHPKSKTPLPIFFVDLESTENVQSVYKITSLLNCSISVEEPYKRRDIPQCTRCQSYNHTKTYCNHPARCVKCGGEHASQTCTKPRDRPATCALCQGSHPANYRGCQVYQELQKRKQHPASAWSRQERTAKQHSPPPVNIAPPPVTSQTFPNIVNSPSQSLPVFCHPSANRPSYAKVTAQETTPTATGQPDLTNVLTSFLTDFKNMITPLLTLLTTVITKLVNSK